MNNGHKTLGDILDDALNQDLASCRRDKLVADIEGVNRLSVTIESKKSFIKTLIDEYSSDIKKHFKSKEVKSDLPEFVRLAKIGKKIEAIKLLRDMAEPRPGECLTDRLGLIHAKRIVERMFDCK